MSENQSESKPASAEQSCDEGLSSGVLLADLTRIKREIFALRNHPANNSRAQAHMDTAREYLRAASVAVESYAANAQVDSTP